MASLVAYDGSSSEGEEDEVIENSTAVISFSLQSSNLNTSEQSEKLRESFSLRFEEFLPKPKNEDEKNILVTEGGNFADIIEDIGPIPPKKIYGDEEPPPIPSVVTARIGFGIDGRNDVTATRSSKGVMQISIPSLKEFENDPDIEDEFNRRKKLSMSNTLKKSSGLFAILPEPKGGGGISLNTSKSSKINNQIDQNPSTTTFLKPKTPSISLIPHVVQQTLSGKRPVDIPINEKLAQVRAKYSKQESNFKIVSKSKSSKKVKNNSDDSEDSSDDESKDFFSLDESTNKFDINSVNMDDYPGINSHEMDENENNDDDELASMEVDVEEQEALPKPNFTDLEQVQRQQEDLMKYIQPERKNKGKAQQPPINIIDVRADDLRPHSTDWLKTITDKSIIPPRRANLPGGLSKRKHQITYLAAEAKAREEELQNQWAHNKHSRRQTQSKYGF